jgi:hypothetical protein
VNAWFKCGSLITDEKLRRVIMVFARQHSNLEFNMYSAAAVAIQEEVRGVYCAYCGIPVRLSAGLLRREAMLREESSPQQQLQTRVFPARCRSCRAEGIYTMDQIVDLPR